MAWASLVAQTVKNLPAMQETQVQSLNWEDPLEKGIATHSSILAWRIPWTEEPGGLQSMGSQKLDMTEQVTLTRDLWWPVSQPATHSDFSHTELCVPCVQREYSGPFSINTSLVRCRYLSVFQLPEKSDLY